MQNTILFDAVDSFHISQKEELHPIIQAHEDLLPEIFHHVKYVMSSWPTVIHTNLTDQLHELCQLFPKFLQDIPSLYFENDVERLADFYFDGHQMPAQFALMCYNQRIPVSARLDLVLSKEGFKILEVNMGSSIGGIEFQNFDTAIRKLHPELNSQEDGKSYVSRPTQTLYIKFVVDSILEYVSDYPKEINILLASIEHEQTDGIIESKTRNFFNDILKKELEERNIRGNVYIAPISSTRFENAALQLGDTHIHGVLVLNYALNATSPDLFRAFISNKVYFPDHIGTRFTGDKRNLAILRELAENSKFSKEHNQLILDHIPWTVVIKEGRITYKDKRYSIKDLLINLKDKFVIKIGIGLSGDGVFIGKFSSDDVWENAINEALTTQKYIAQEFCQSQELMAPNSSNQWVKHNIIWGAFSFGDDYGGTFVRMLPTSQDTGIVNASKGAFISMVYEKNDSLIKS